MLSGHKISAFSLFVVGFAVLFANASPVFAQSGGGNGIRLFAHSRVGQTTGKAKYEEIKGNSRRKFSFEMEKATAGAVVQVSVGSTTMGTATVNAVGRAKFELDTRLGQGVPQMGVGTLVTVKLNGLPFAQTPLR